MFKQTSNRLLIFLFSLLWIGISTSCKKNDESPNKGMTELYSFGPTGTKIGDTLRFIGINLDKVSSIEFTGENAVVNQDRFTLKTSELIKLIVPESAEKGFVTLKLNSGETITTKTQLNLNVLTTIQSFTPAARPGEDITITGTFLNWVDRVTFARDKVVTDFVSQSASQIVVTVPEDAETGALIIHYGGTDSADIEMDDVIEIALPVGTTITPNPAKHANNISIKGTNLDLARKVYFTGEANPVTSFVSQTATELVVKVPASTTDGSLVLEAPSGVTTTVAGSLSVVLPAVTGLSPNPVNPEANVTITGTNLDLVSSVAFTGVNDPVSSFVSQSTGSIVVKVPADALTGKITLNVKNSTLSVKSGNDLTIAGSSVTPIIIFDDVLNWNGWTGGGWGGTFDVNNTSPVRAGTKSVKISFNSGGWGVPWQLGGANYPLAGYNTLKFSVYGGTGSNGSSVNIGINEADGATFTVTEGAWKDISIPLSDITSADNMGFLYFKNYTPSGDFTIYLDNIGIY